MRGFRWEICGRCEGNGHIDNPNSDGYTASEWQDMEPEDRDNYMAGRYDVPCHVCKGSGKVQVSLESA